MTNSPAHALTLSQTLYTYPYTFAAALTIFLAVYFSSQWNLENAIWGVMYPSLQLHVAEN